MHALFSRRPAARWWRPLAKAALQAVSVALAKPGDKELDQWFDSSRNICFVTHAVFRPPGRLQMDSVRTESILPTPRRVVMTTRAIAERLS